MSVARAVSDRILASEAALPTPRVLSFTSLFPNGKQPLHGLFVRQRVLAMSRQCDLEVMAPVPWLPTLPGVPARYRSYADIPAVEMQDGLRVAHPRFLTIPKVGKTLDAAFMARSCRPAVAAMRQRFPFDLIDAHWAYPDGVAAALLAREFNVPLAITVRGDDINIFARETFRKPWIRWALRRAAVVFALSRELKEHVEALAGPAARVMVVPNGVDAARFRPLDRAEARRRLGIPMDATLLLSTGRLHHSKGFPVLVRALQSVRSRFPTAQLAIVGASDAEADARPDILRTAAALGISEHVRLPGPADPDTLVSCTRRPTCSAWRRRAKGRRMC